MNTKKQVTDAEMDQISQNTGDELAKQDKVKIKLHLDPAEKLKLQKAKEADANVQWPCETVIVNGYNYVIKRGIEVEVPETVRDILEHAGMI